MKIKCSVCKKTIETPGALLFGPPDKSNRTLKKHLCVECYRRLIYQLKLIRCPVMHNGSECFLRIGHRGKHRILIHGGRIMRFP